ncbi:DNA ligase D [Pseudomonas sp. NA-150]|uniref:DNA ligase D n=1 Tax=Pseudomonas sp. NA-150 TaxID=3367525 RepID=UPI0037CBD2D2
MENLKIATFNVNGISARLANLLQWLERERPDVVCLQELKAQDKVFPARDLEAAGYGSLHHGQASWNGVAILARDSEPLQIHKGLPGAEDDSQSRYLEAAVHGVIVACLYLPNGNPQPGPKFDYKLRWFEQLIEHAKTLQCSEHPVVLAGDFNVVPADMDIYNTRSWLKDALLQPESRECYQRLLAQGWIDSIRHLYPEERVYTFWDYFRQHWQKNSGLRIDHLLLNPVLAPHLQEAGVDAWVRGEAHASDHAPTWIQIGPSQSKSKSKSKSKKTSRSVKKAPEKTDFHPHPLLQEYDRKRDFDATPEPSGTPNTMPSVKKKTGAPTALRFCIQKHDATRLHYDFRLELDGTLKSWAVPKGPSLDPKAKRLAVHVEDHPVDYATFEGNIPEGHYGAGDVIVWDRGIWKPLTDPVEAYAKGRLKFELQGEKLGGVWNLVKTHIPGKQEQWFLIKHQDEFARPESDYDVVKSEPHSVLSERTIVPKKRGKAVEPKPVKKAPAPRKKSAKAQLKNAQAANLPDSIKPELATLVESAPEGDWRYEIKFDGYRMMARVDNGKVQLFTRNGHDWTNKLPRQAEAIASLALESAWLDGEMVVANDQGVPDFQALQNAFEAGRSGNIVFYLFDMPFLNGMDLREVPVEQRRAALATVLKRSEDEVLRFSEDFGENPEALLNSACQMQMEGLIGKRVGSPYVSRRSGDWIKLKCKRRQEFVIVGYSEPKGARSKFGALLLGLHDTDRGDLKYAGKVGTGFIEATLKTIYDQLVPLETKKPAVINPPTGFEAKGIHWLKPVLLAEVAFAEITKEGSVRHAVFHGLRMDKPAQSITEELPASSPTPAKTTASKKAGAVVKSEAKTDSPITPGKIRLTHPERVIDPSSGATKRDLADYYIKISDWLIPQLAHRPVALVRAPEGIAGELFFQKNADRLNIPGIETMGKEYTGHPVMLVNNIEALIGAVQMSTIELHAWNAVSKDLQRPDRFILDLDPDPALPWKSMVEATQLTLAVLDELGLTSFLKTSGGKGIHLVVPLSPKADWDAVKDFSHAIVKHIAKLLPDRFSAVSGPKNRVGRIFIDYLRNGLGATTISAYSARTREGLPVSVPIFREELLEIKGANVWNIRNVHERLSELDADPWADLAKTKQTITAQMRKRVGLK